MLGTNHVLENSQKLPPRVFQPLGASTLAHGWVRTVRTAQNLHNTDIQWAERGVEANFVHPKFVHSGPIEPELWPGSIYKDRMRWPTHINGLAAAIRRHRAGASTHPEMRHRMPQPNGPYCSLQPFHVVW